MLSLPTLALLAALAFTSHSHAPTHAAQDKAPGTSQASRPSITLSDCDVPGVQGKARCGTYEVFENRATRRGRKISLRVVVLPATGAERAPDPYFFLNGGPGVSSVEAAAGIAQDLAPIRARRDLVFLDQRGTGGSNPLLCPLYDPADAQSAMREFFPPEAVKRCRPALEAKADLTLYTTDIAADDMDEVRAALGYERINIFGASYGTRAALVYLKRHPRSVRTVTLQGVAPTHRFMPLDFPQSAQRALDGVIGECERDEACRRAFPRVREEARAVFEKLKKAPVEASVTHPRGGVLGRVKLSRNLAAEAVRYMLYSSMAATRVPAIIHRAAAGDFGPLASAAYDYRRHLVDADSNGLYLSITCAEDLPFIKPGEGERTADDTFIGHYRLTEQRAACALWPRAPVPTDYSEPTRADAPVLILTGQWDPVTPPSQGDEAARSLPNSLHVVVPQGGHGFGGLQGRDCIRRLMVEFVERGTAKGLDTACVAGIKRQAFATALQ
jgi:pimeloyl-ACP methyl ester carboxylesterase